MEGVFGMEKQYAVFLLLLLDKVSFIAFFRETMVSWNWSLLQYYYSLVPETTTVDRVANLCLWVRCNQGHLTPAKSTPQSYLSCCICKVGAMQNTHNIILPYCNFKIKS